MNKKYPDFLIDYAKAQDEESRKKRLETLILETLEMFSSQGEDSAYVMVSDGSLVDYAIEFLKKEILVPENKIKLVYDTHTLQVLGVEIYFKGVL